MNPTFTCDIKPLQKAVREYQKFKGYSEPKAVNKTMGEWIKFTSNKFKRLEAGKIRAELTGPGKRGGGHAGAEGKVSSGKNKRLDALQNSLAAYIVASRLKKKGQLNVSINARRGNLKKNGGSGSQAAFDEFYDRVRRMINSRARGAGYLKSGFIPALQAYHVPNRGKSPPFKARGNSMGKPALPNMDKPVAFVRNAREGAAKRYGQSFQQTIPEVIARLHHWIDESIHESAMKAGFHVR